MYLYTPHFERSTSLNVSRSIDSVAVQLLEQQKTLDMKSIGEMAELVEGSFVFTVLDEHNNMYFVKGDNPLALYHYEKVYLLTGKVRCAVCGGYYCGTRKTNGKGKYSFSYICNGRKSNGCTNPSVNRSYVESFVLDKLAEYVFSDKMIPVITEEYNNYLSKRDNSSVERIEELYREKSSISQKISMATDMLIETQSKALMNKLMLMEKRQEAIERELGYLEKAEQQSRVSETQLAEAFQEIRLSLKSGTLKNVKQLVDKYVQRVDIYPEKIVVVFNLFPHLRPDKTNNDEHSGKGCSSFYACDVPNIMTKETTRAAFDTGYDGNFVRGMKILKRLRK